MANQHQSYNPGSNQSGMNAHRMPHFQQRMPPPTNQIRGHYPQQQQSYPAGHAVPPYIQPAVPMIQQQYFYPTQTNGVRNPAPMPASYMAAPQYNTFQQTMQPAGSANQPTQQNIYSQQTFIPGVQGGMYPGGLPQHRPYLTFSTIPTQGTPMVQQGYPGLPGGMPPHSQQPAQPPSSHMPPGAPLPPQQGGKPPFQQVSISASIPPPSSTPSQQAPVVSSISGTGLSSIAGTGMSSISGSAPPFQPPQQLHQQITVSQPPPQFPKKERRPLNIVNPVTGKSIFEKKDKEGGSSGAPGRSVTTPHSEESASLPPPDTDKPPPTNSSEGLATSHQDGPDPNLQQPPPLVHHQGPPPSTTPNSLSTPPTSSMPPPLSSSTHSAPPPSTPSSIPSTDIKEATPPPAAVTRGHEVVDSASQSQVDSASSQSQVVVSEPAPAQDKEMLSVAVESKRDETLYEPVSPTPLPDSPVEEAKGVSGNQQQTSVSQPPPSQSGASSQHKHDRQQSQQDDDTAGFTEAARRKKKSVATKKAELNRKGQEKERKGGDLLDVFKPNVDPAETSAAAPPPSQAAGPGPTSSSTNKGTGSSSSAAKQQTPEPVFKEPTPPAPKEPSPLLPPTKKEPTPPVMKTETDNSRQHSATPETVKVNGVGGGDKMDVVDTPQTATTGADELEEGEIPDDSPARPDENGRSKSVASSGGGSEVKLKYQYKEDMWSPLNPFGKKQYDRDFLIQLQFDDLSQIKPLQLPDMDIIKDEPIRRDISRSSYNIEPSYIKSSVSQSRGHGGRESGMSKRPSKSKEPVKRINIPSMSQNVVLNKAEKAWVPTSVVMKKGIDKEGDEIEVLKKKVRSILNKLTPQKFETLVQQFQELTIETKVKLEASMELVFEKAVDEPAFSVAYAQMCQILSFKEIMENGQQVKFTSVLIKRVQKEFEKDYMKDVDQKLKLKAEDPELPEEQRRNAREEYEAQELKARRRSLGNIKFIGELYNLNILTCTIMHQCVNRLLNKTDEESLEGLCRLVTTVGAQFDMETAKIISQKQSGRASEQFMNKHAHVESIDYYFQRMNKIINSRSTSSRVRFLMQDVIDLKRAGWKKRREEAGPKKIDQIHEDVKKEKQIAELNNMASNMPYPKQRDSQGPPGGDARRRSQRGTTTDSDGWQITNRPARNTFDKVDTNKLKSMSRNTTQHDVESMSLGPKSFGAWSKGSTGSRGVSRPEEINTSNRYAGFSSSESSSNAPYEGRTSGGYEGRSSTGYEGRMSSGYGGRMGGGRPGSYVGRSSRGQPDEYEKAKAIQAVKEFHPGQGPGGRSVSTIMSSDSDRGRTSVPNKSASMRIPSKKRDQDAGFQGSPDADRDKLETISESRVNEFLSTKDFEEVHKGLKEKFHPKTVNIFLETTFNNALEKRAEERKLVGLLFSSLVKEGLVSEEKLIEGLNTILEIGTDLEVDIPKFWDILASVLVASVMDSNLTLLALTNASRTTEPEVKNRAKFLAALLHSVKAESASKVAMLWSQSGVDLQQFLTSENGAQQNVDSFMKDNKLDFLLTTSGSNSQSSATSASSAFDPAAFSSDLRNRLKANSSDVVTFITDRVSNLNNPDFVRTVVTVLAEDSLEGLGGPVGDIRLNEMKFNTYCTEILAEVVQGTDMEVQCLFAIQTLAHRLEHPSALFSRLLDVMYNSDVVTYQGCQSWKNDKTPENQTGKGVCVAASASLFTIMSEEIQEEDEQEA